MMDERCSEYRDRIPALVSGDLPADEREQIEGHLSQCAVCHAYLDALEEDDRLLEGFVESFEENMRDLEHRIVGAVRDAAGPGKVSVTVTGADPARNRRFRILAAAASVVFLLLAWQLFNRPPLVPIAWAEVITQVVEAHNYVCRVWSDTNLPGDNEQESVRYLSKEFGFRNDIYADDRLVLTEYILPSERAFIGVVPDDEAWMRIWLRDSEIEEVLRGSSAQEMVADFRSASYRELGQKRIDGIMASGIEVQDPDFIKSFFEGGWMRLWVDVETNWPVIMEGKWTADGGRLQIRFEFTDFQWNVDLPPEMFEPDIRRNYELALELDIPVVDEQHAIEGLRVFADIMRGHYPKRPVIMTALNQYFDERRIRSRSQRQSLREIEQLNRVRSMFEFYGDLLKEGNDVAYHGARVMRRDFDKVLLRCFSCLRYMRP